MDRITTEHLESMAARLAVYTGPVSLDVWQGYRAFRDATGRTIVCGSTDRELFELGAAWFDGAYFVSVYGARSHETRDLLVEQDHEDAWLEDAAERADLDKLEAQRGN